MTAKVQCDKCEWTELTPTFADTLKWHGLQCPQCGDCVIVNDADAEVLRGLMGLQDAGLIKLLEPGEEAALKLTLNTRSLRDN